MQLQSGVARSATASDPRRIWVNGEERSVAVAHISAVDRGFTLADGVFETMRVEGGAAFRLTHHLRRLRHGLAALSIPAPNALDEWIRKAIAAWVGGAATLRVTVTRGVGPPGVAFGDGSDPTTVVTLGPAPPSARAIHERGIVAHIASGRRNEHAVTSGLKTLSYTEGIAAWREARRAGADDAIMLDTAGHCSEAVFSNLFVRRQGELITPSLSCGALPGITRGAVLELAAHLAIRACERVLTIEELLAADEVFLSSTVRGIVPVVRVGDSWVAAGAPGEWAKALSDAYDLLIVSECRGSGTLDER